MGKNITRDAADAFDIIRVTIEVTVKEIKSDAVFTCFAFALLVANQSSSLSANNVLCIIPGPLIIKPRIY